MVSAYKIPRMTSKIGQVLLTSVMDGSRWSAATCCKFSRRDLLPSPRPLPVPTLYHLSALLPLPAMPKRTHAEITKSFSIDIEALQNHTQSRVVIDTLSSDGRRTKRQDHAIFVPLAEEPPRAKRRIHPGEDLADGLLNWDMLEAGDGEDRIPADVASMGFATTVSITHTLFLLTDCAITGARRCFERLGPRTGSFPHGTPSS